MSNSGRSCSITKADTVIGILPALSGIAEKVSVAALFGLCNIKEHLKTVLKAHLNWTYFSRTTIMSVLIVFKWFILLS